MSGRDDALDLRPGDVVEMYRTSWPVGQKVVGPVSRDGIGLVVAGLVVGWVDGGVIDADKRVTVISRAPRPLYANHPRTEPVQGDVVRFEDSRRPDDSYTNAYDPAGNETLPWLELQTGYRYSRDEAEPENGERIRMVLLVDGETGQVVP